MTYQEAIKLIDEFSSVYKGRQISRETLSECISKETLIEYRKVVCQALEKQICKKPITKNIVCGDMNYKRFYCPNCKKLIVTKVSDDFDEELIDENGFAIEEPHKYCDDCGKALDWGDI